MANPSTNAATAAAVQASLLNVIPDREDRLAQRDEQHELAAIGEVSARKRPVSDRRAAQARQQEAVHRCGVVDHERDDPERQAEVAVGERAGDPRHGGDAGPGEQVRVVQPHALAAQRNDHEGAAHRLQRDVGDRERHGAIEERLRDRGRHDRAQQHQREQEAAHRSAQGLAQFIAHAWSSRPTRPRGTGRASRAPRAGTGGLPGGARAASPRTRRRGRRRARRA